MRRPPNLSHQRHGKESTSGHWPFVPTGYFCDSWSKATWSPGCQGLCCLWANWHQRTPVPDTWGSPLGGPARRGHCQRKGPQGHCPQRARLSKNSSFQGEKKRARKTGLCKQSLLCTLQPQPQRLPKEQAVHMGGRGSVEGNTGRTNMSPPSHRGR